MAQGGEGVQPGDDKLSDPGCCIEACGKAGEDSSVEGIFDLELLTELGNEVSGVRLPFLFLGRGGVLAGQLP